MIGEGSIWVKRENISRDLRFVNENWEWYVRGRLRLYLRTRYHNAKLPAPGAKAKYHIRVTYIIMLATAEGGAAPTQTYLNRGLNHRSGGGAEGKTAKKIE